MAGHTNGNGKAAPVRTRPKYADLIVDAVEMLKKGKGSSKQAIFKHIVQNCKLGDNLKTVSTCTSAAYS